MVFAMPLLALVAGAISFSSPCCLPLLPGYVSFISGLPMEALDQRASRRVALRAALFFVAGFTAVFTLLGVSFALVGSVLLRNVPVITRVAGVLIVVMGLSMVGVLRVPLLYSERRMMGRVRPGPRSAFLLGITFAFGWAPCIGPVLATILTAAAATSTVIWGAILLVLYSIGLGPAVHRFGVGSRKGEVVCVVAAASRSGGRTRRRGDARRCRVAVRQRGMAHVFHPVAALIQPIRLATHLSPVTLRLLS